MNFSIRNQVTLIGGGLILIVALLAVGIMLYGQGQIMHLQAKEDVKNTQLIVESNHLAGAQRLYDRLVSFTRNQPLKQALYSGEASEAQDILGRNFKRLSATKVVSHLQAVSASGQQMAMFPETKQLNSETLVQRVLSQQRVIMDTISDQAGMPLIAVGFPLYLETGKPVGVIVLAQTFDNYLLNLAKSQDIGFAIVTHKNEIGSTFGDGVPRQFLEPLQQAASLQEKHYVEFSEAGHYYTAINLPIFDADKHWLGSVVLIRNIDDIQEIKFQELLYISLVTGVFVILALWIFWIFLKRTFDPLEKAEYAVSEMAKGDLHQPLQAKGQNEISRLVAGLEKMR